MLLCPACNAWTEVLETRTKDNIVRRRYRCANEHRFSTKEVIVPSKAYRVNPKSKRALESDNGLRKGTL